ncbi:MAG TPA: MFS transporter [Xanthobacteraceae bacterium]|jgi:MFS family permease|nr:MFS transporter [Xanthobacteraceae bacterium]
MPGAHGFRSGPWRAVMVLGVTQILAWGTLFYPPVLTVPLIAADRDWSKTFAMGGFSVGLLIAGLVSPTVGGLIDRHGGHRIMPVGSLLGAAGLFGLVHAGHPIFYLLAWAVLGVAMAASLYDPAFASLGRIFGLEARRPMTLVTFAGGFASTVSWPVTHFLIDAVGWRGAYLVYAGLLAAVAAPLHAFALPRTQADAVPRTTDTAAPLPGALSPNGLVFWLVAIAFAAYAFVLSGFAAHMLAILGRFGIDAGTVVLVGALFGPSQVTARLCEFVFARNIHPLWIARFSVGAIVLAFVLLWTGGISATTAALFAIMFGGANGLATIARGTLPLALFGAKGYGRLMGRIAGPFLFSQAAAPLVVAFVIDNVSDVAALALMASFALASLACFALVRRPAPAF